MDEYFFFFCSAPTPIVGSNSAHVLSSDGDPPMDICNDSLTIESYRFSQRYAELNILERDSRRFENSIMGSGHTFPNAVEFRDAVYVMLITGRFRYCFKRNSRKHMTVVCTVNECPWKVIAHAIGESNIVQVHTFQNHHNHSLEDGDIDDDLDPAMKEQLERLDGYINFHLIKRF